MITVICHFKLASHYTPQTAQAVFLQSVPRFNGMDGLVRKYFLLSEDGRSGASVYLWTSRQPAEAFFTEEWMEFMRQKYGYRPTIAYYDCPIVVDNAYAEVITDMG